MIIPAVLIAKMPSASPAVMLKAVGVPVVVTVPTSAAAALFSFIEKVAPAKTASCEPDCWLRPLFE